MNDDILKQAADAYPGLILPPYDGLTALVGYESVCAFADAFGGCNLYVPMKRHIFKDCLMQAAFSEFNGANYGQLARKYGFCEKQVRKIVKRNRAAAQSG